MYIDSLNLYNFRNYDNYKIDFSDKLNIISGKNGVGKTNILEAIYFSAFSKSFKTNKDREMIKYEKDFLKSNLVFYKGGRKQNIEIALLSLGKKQIKINGSVITNISDLIGVLNVVFFAPEDLRIIIGSPGDRRRFMDREISQIYASYYDNLIKYNKVLAQRNNQLKNTDRSSPKTDLIKLWDDPLIEYGVKIIKKRWEFIKNLEEYAVRIHSDLSSNNEQLELEYNSNIPLGKNMEDSFRVVLNKSLTNDINYGYTTRGIHKDDFTTIVNSLPVKTFGSQGQKRTSALSIKLSQVHVIERITGSRPILLLDDVSSELDSSRRNILLDIVKDSQCIITTTDIKDFIDKRYIFKDISL